MSSRLPFGLDIPRTLFGWNYFLVIPMAVISLLSTVVGLDWLALMSMISMTSVTVVTLALALGLGYTKMAVVFASSLVNNTCPVRLVFFDGKMINSLATRNQDGSFNCPVYWMTGTGDCHLLPNGTVSRDSDSSYIVMWWPLRKADMVYHQLRNDVLDISSIMRMDKVERRKKLLEMLSG